MDPAVSLWSLLVLIGPGLLFLTALRRRGPVSAGVLDSLPIMLATALVASITIGAVSLVLCSLAGLGLVTAAIVSWILAAGAALAVKGRRGDPPGSMRIEPAVLALAVLVGVIMYFNGGLTERLADSWWHMAYARKMIFEDSIFIDYQHAHGNPETSTVYPFLWHGLVAQIQVLSSGSLESIWHTLTVLISIVSVLGYYALARSLNQGPLASLIAVLLFVIALGGLNTYFRVNAWPGNVGYLVWYVLTALVFGLADRKAPRFPAMLLLIPAVVTLAVVHTAGLGLFLLALFIYAVCWAGARLAYPGIGNELPIVESDYNYLKPVVYFLAAALALIVVFRLALDPEPWPLTRERAAALFLALAAIAAVVLVVLRAGRRLPDRRFGWLVAAVLLVAVAGLVDWLHFLALFDPDLESFRTNPHIQRPQPVDTVFGEGRLPHWDHQIRVAVLPLGIIATAVSVIMLFLAPSRAAVFCAANAVFAMLAINSPWIFTALLQITEYSSAYRVHMLILAPIILAMAIAYCLERLRPGER